MIECGNCIYSEPLVEKGTEVKYLNVVGEEQTKVQSATIYRCRFFPPITGDWTTTVEGDWCGQYEKSCEGTSSSYQDLQTSGTT